MRRAVATDEREDHAGVIEYAHDLARDRLDGCDGGAAVESEQEQKSHGGVMSVSSFGMNASMTLFSSGVAGVADSAQVPVIGPRSASTHVPPS